MALILLHVLSQLAVFSRAVFSAIFNVLFVHQVIIFRLVFLKYVDSFFSFLLPFFHDHLPE